MKKILADLHVHPGLKGFANQGFPENEGRTIWDAYPSKKEAIQELNKLIRATIEEIAKESQAHLDACVSSHLKIPFLSIYPVERQMFALERRKPFRTLWKILLPIRKYSALGAAVSGFPREKVEKILMKNVRGDQNDGVNYFEQYELERDYLLEQTKTKSKEYTDFSFQIADHYEDLKALVSQENNIVGILTVEGSHSFGHYKYHTTFSKTFDQLDADEKALLRDSLLQNIQKVKEGDFPPFFVTFCHHFNNLLAGHARSMTDKASLVSFLGWPNKPGLRHIFNQEPNLGNGYSSLGKEVLALFLDREKGRRILVDTKHMNIPTRREFYQLIRQRREEGDHIPIVCSHTAVSGWPTLDEAEQHPEDKNIDKGAFFSRWRINLTNEDILQMYDSDGIIGMLMHEGRMPGGLFNKEARKLKKELKKLKKEKRNQKNGETEKCYCRLREHYLKLMWSNVFHILKVVWEQREGNAWKMIALGSDYDGLVNPFNTYSDVHSFFDLKQQMAEYLKEGKTIFYADRGLGKQLSQQEVKQLMFGQEVEEVVDALFYNNVDAFLSKYFTLDYLRAGKNPSDFAISRPSKASPPKFGRIS